MRATPRNSLGSLVSASLLFFAAIVGPGLHPCVSSAYCIDYEEHPHWVSHLPMASDAWGVAVEGNLAYIASQTAFQVVDITDPAQPRQVGSCSLPAAGGDVVIRGNYAYVADFTNGLLAIDIRDPGNPFIAGGISTYGYAIGLFSKGDLLYLTTAVVGNPVDSRLQIFSVAADPVSPVLIGMESILSYGWDVAVVGSIAYVAASFAGTSRLVTIDVTDPANPAFVGMVNTGGNAHGVAVTGEIAYVACYEGGLVVARVADPAHPRIIAHLPTPGLAFAVSMKGTLAVVGDDEAGLQLVDGSVPENPRIVGAVDTPGFAHGLAIVDRTAYVADWNGFLIADLGTDPSPIYYPRVDTPGLAIDVAVRGGYAYVADWITFQMQVIQVSGVSTPHPVGHLDRNCSSVSVNGNRVYMIGGNSLVIVDVSHPTAPVAHGQVSLPGTALDVAVADPDNPVEYAFVAADGLQVVRVTGDVPEIVGSTNAPRQANGVAVVGDYAFVTDLSQPNLYIVNAADPAHPAIVATLPIGGSVQGVAASPGEVCVVTTDRLVIVDVTNPSQPFIASSVGLNSAIWSKVTVNDGTAYVVQADVGTTVIDVSDPARAHVIGAVVGMHNAIGVAAWNCSVYVADQDQGIEILPAQEDTGTPQPMAASETPSSPASRPVLIALTPNPARGSVTIRFDVPVAGHAGVEVFDVAGRRVRSLLDKEIAAGSHDLPWDGFDAAGRRAPRGTYFIRLSWNRITETGRLILLQ